MPTCNRKKLAKIVGLATLLSIIQGCSFVQTAFAQCVPSNFPSQWLQQQESLGGHTISRHVNKTDQELVNRLIKTPRISAASTYPNLSTAATNIQAALSANSMTLNNWFGIAATGEKRAVNYTAHTVVGRTAIRPPSLSNIVNSRKLRAVMKKTAQGKCLLLTSYPIR